MRIYGARRAVFVSPRIELALSAAAPSQTLRSVASEPSPTWLDGLLQARQRVMFLHQLAKQPLLLNLLLLLDDWLRDPLALHIESIADLNIFSLP